jgi:hypothetical protein
VRGDPVPDVVHHVHHEAVGRLHGQTGVVDEAALDVAPAAAEPDPVVGAEQQLGVVLLECDVVVGFQVLDRHGVSSVTVGRHCGLVLEEGVEELPVLDHALSKVFRRRMAGG